MYKSTQKNIAYIAGLITFVLLVYIAVYFVVVPYVFRIPTDFKYTADILSLDNFYDANIRDFVGERRSVTTFAYQSTKSDDTHADILNTFDVHTLDGEIVINVSRTHHVNRYTWMHAQDGGDTVRYGALFAPRNTSADQSFTYWHVGYDTPLQMVYRGEEMVEGVRTYRFSTDFGADQTHNLTHLPGVPETLGVSTDGQVTLWIEPVSGWLVKYTDRGTAYYYDRESGVRTDPWNTFSNQYTKTSIQEQAAYAQSRKMQMLAVTYGVPLLVLSIGLAFLGLGRFSRLAMITKAVLLGIIAVVVATLFFWYMQPAPPEQFTVGIVRWVTNSGFDDNIEGFKSSLAQSGFEEGKNITFLDKTVDADVRKLEQTLTAYRRRDVDLLYVLSTPGTLAVKSFVDDIPIVFSVVLYPVETGIVDSLLHSGNNLVGTRTWVNPAEEFNLFLEVLPRAQTLLFIDHTDEPNSKYQFREFVAEGAQRDIAVAELSAANLDQLTSALVSLSELPDLMYLSCDTFVQSDAARSEIISFAQEHKIPTAGCNKDAMDAGALMGVVADFGEQGKISGQKAAFILDGASPTSLETSPVTRPFVYINKKTADELDVVIPQSVLAKAKEIIQ